MPHWKATAKAAAMPQMTVKAAKKRLAMICRFVRVRRATNKDIDSFEAQMASIYKIDAA